MRVIKLGLISIVVFSLLITVFSLFFPSNVRISKATDINSTGEVVIKQLSDTANWKSWYPGADSIALPVITAVTDSTVQAEGVVPGSQKAVMGWNVYNSSAPNMVTVQWYMDFHLRWYPWEKFSSLLLEKRYGPLMERGGSKN